MVRLSMVDKHNREFFMTIPERGAKKFRERRDEAIDAIQEAISLGLQPGQVHLV